MGSKNSEVNLVFEAKVKTCWPGASDIRIFKSLGANMKRMWKSMIILKHLGEGEVRPQCRWYLDPEAMGLCSFPSTHFLLSNSELTVPREGQTCFVSHSFYKT